MPACQAWGCSNRNDRGENVRGFGKTYFQIPNARKDPKKKILADRWLHNIGTGWTSANFKFGRHKVVCQDHFEQSCFQDDMKSRLLGTKVQLKLQPEAVPTMLVHRRKVSDATRLERMRKRAHKQEITTLFSFASSIKGQQSGTKKSKKDKAVKDPHTDGRSQSSTQTCSVSIAVQTDEWCSDCGHHTRHKCCRSEVEPVPPTLDHPYMKQQAEVQASGSTEQHEDVLPSTPSEDRLEASLDITEEYDCESIDTQFNQSFSTTISSNSCNDSSSFHPSTDSDTDSICSEESVVDPVDHLVSQDKYIVFSDSLDELLYQIPCKQCSCPVDEIKKSFFGSMITAKLYCTGGHEVLFWKSQPLLNDKASAGNVLLSASILFTGQTYKHVADVASLLNLKFVGQTTFNDTQKDYLLPVIEDFWKAEQLSVLTSLQNSTVQVSGDGRCYSPGYSARYCNYTMMDHNSLKILDFEVVEVTEAKSSAGMEKIGFERVLDRLIGCSESELGMHVVISDVATDRHVSVRKLMRKKYKPINIEHQFDAYHSLRKKLKHKCRYKKFSPLAPWVQSLILVCSIM